MKNILKKISLLSVSLTFTVLIISGCKNFLEVQPKSQISIADAFSNVANATNSIIGVYDELMGDNGYGIRINMYYPYDSDEIIVSGNIDNGRRGIGRYQLLLTNAELRNPFLQLYRGIEKANLCIEQIPMMALYTSGTDAEENEIGVLPKGRAELLVVETFHAIGQFHVEPRVEAGSLDAGDDVAIEMRADQIHGVAAVAGRQAHGRTHDTGAENGDGAHTRALPVSLSKRCTLPGAGARPKDAPRVSVRRSEVMAQTSWPPISA